MRKKRTRKQKAQEGRTRVNSTSGEPHVKTNNAAKQKDGEKKSHTVNGVETPKQKLN